MKKSQTKTAVMLAAAAAAAFFFFRSKPAKAAGLPAADVPDPDGAPPEAEPEPPGTPPRNAPPLTGTVATNIAALNQAAGDMIDDINSDVWDAMNLGDWSGPPPIANESDVAVVRSAMGIPAGRTIASWVTDEVYFARFGDGARVPDESMQGNGWNLYTQIWVAVWERAKARLLDGVNAH